MTAPKYTIKQGDNGPEYWQGDAKAFFTNKAGNIQAAHGFAETREDFDTWLDHWHATHKEPNIAPEDGSPLSEYQEEQIENVIEEKTERAPEQPLNPIICPIISNGAGDKDPAVVEWWFKNYPVQAANKYAGRRIERRSEGGIIL